MGTSPLKLAHASPLRSKGVQTTELPATGQASQVAGILPARLHSSGSPYARIGLWRNPFGELTRAERAELALIDVQQCLVKLAEPRAAVQIFGPCGHGKTTHLLAIERALPGSGYVYFPEDGAQPSLPCGRPLLVDEAQRLGWRRRWQLLREAGPLALATHVDLSRGLRRAGFEVFTIDVSIPKSAAELRQILNRRIEASRLPSRTQLASGAGGAPGEDSLPHPLCLRLEEVVALQQQFGSNIRRIEHHLYDEFQRLAAKGTLWPLAR